MSKDMQPAVNLYLPPKPTRNTIVDPPTGIYNVQTYNGFNYDENVESLKLAIRKCESRDAMFRCLESLRTNSDCGHDTVKELLLCATLEVGPANPSVIVMIDNLIGRDVLALDYADVTTAAEILCMSPKSPLFSLLSDSTSLKPVTQRDEHEDTALKLSLIYIESYLSDKDLNSAILEAHKLRLLSCLVDEDMWNALSKIFLHPMRAKHLRKVSAAFWLPVLSRAERCESQRVCDLVHRIYHIALARSKDTLISLREDGRVFALWIHALWALCNLEQVENTWYNDGNIRLGSYSTILTDVERQALITSHLRREFLVGCTDESVNLFTTRGRDKGRGWRHFMDKCVIWSHRLPELHNEETRREEELLTLLTQAGKLE